jgi:hypothetical protein
MSRREIEEAATWAREKRESRAYVDAVKPRRYVWRMDRKDGSRYSSDHAEIEDEPGRLIAFILAIIESGELYCR